MGNHLESAARPIVVVGGLRGNADAMEACFDLARRIDAVGVMCIGGLLFCGPDTRACWDARHRFLAPILLDSADSMASRGEPFVTAHYASALAAQTRAHFTTKQLRDVAQWPTRCSGLGVSMASDGDEDLASIVVRGWPGPHLLTDQGWIPYARPRLRLAPDTAVSAGLASYPGTLGIAWCLSLHFHPGQGHHVEFHSLRYDPGPYIDRLEATGCYPASFTESLRTPPMER